MAGTATTNESLPTAATLGSPVSSPARSRREWRHQAFAQTRLKPPTGLLQALIRQLFEAQIGAQIANEKITACVTDIVEWLTDERKVRGWSVQYMAELLRVEVRTIHRIEQGVAIPRGLTIKRYIEVFGYQYPLTPVLLASQFKPKALVKKATRIRKPKP